MYAMLKTIARYAPADLEALGIQPDHMELTVGNAVWQAGHRDVVIRVMQGLVFGSVKLMGLPPIIVPSEYLAAVVATTIAPENQKVCCVWLAQERMTGYAAIEMAAKNQQPSQWDPTTGDHLFALVCLAAEADETAFARRTLLTKMNIRVAEMEQRVP